jgi:hypothetical protein
LASAFAFTGARSSTGRFTTNGGGTGTGFVALISTRGAVTTTCSTLNREDADLDDLSQ